MKRNTTQVEPCCPVKPALRSRPLISEKQALRLEQTFKTLANSTRLRILHALHLAGELPVGEIAEKLGMKTTAVSNQLQRLLLSGIIEYRREGTQVFYRIIDPCVVKLLDSAWCLSEDAEARTRKEV
jgi:DNA-binding transcriptional ArsR family regulator